MALLQRKPQISEQTPFYTIGQRRSVLLVGLGNPGDKYLLSRHNIGFMCLDDFVSKNEFEPWTHKTDLRYLRTSMIMNDVRVIAIKPTTFMNLSGEAVQAASHFYKIPPESILVVHDELDIMFGQVRTRFGGSGAGHNGVKSIITSLGENFNRVRVGIGPKTPEQIDSAEFVLQSFNAAEQDQMPALLQEVSAVISEFVFGTGPIEADTRTFLLD